MQFSTIILSLCLSGALAAPFKARQAGARSFAELSISSGTAGNALEEANAVIGVSDADIESITEEQLEVLKAEGETSEDAEEGAFNPAIEAASGIEADELQNGKIKNKVLKLAFSVVVLKVEAANGEDNAEKLAEQETKLQNNIDIDAEHAGENAQDVTFNA